MKNDLETKLLKDTILALREELERVQHEGREQIQQAVAESNAEILHLRASIVELRDQLELREAEHEHKAQNLRLQHEHQISEMHRTIAILRAKVEELNESTQRTRRPAKAQAAARTSH
jgi:hypothetical protein